MPKRNTNLRKLDLYLTILHSIKTEMKLPTEGFIKSDGAKATLQSNKRKWHAKKLIELNYIKKTGYASWELTEEGENFYNKLQAKSQCLGAPIKCDLSSLLFVGYQ